MWWKSCETAREVAIHDQMHVVIAAPDLATSSGLAISSGAMNSGVPQGSAGCRKKTAKLKSISLIGASGALHRGMKHRA